MDDVGARPHGRRSTYLDGCRCLPCRSANASYQAHRRERLARGKPLPGVVIQGHYTAQLVRSLLAEGFSASRVGHLLGMSEATIRRHRSSAPVTLRTAARVQSLWRAYQGSEGMGA